MKQKGKLLLLSWSVHPVGKAMAVLVNNIAKNMEYDEIVVVGEKVLGNPKDWDEINYKLHYVNPFFFKQEKGYQYLRWLKFFPILSKIKKIAKDENCTSILCTFPNEYYLALGYKLSVDLNIPFYPWYHNLYIENMKGYRFRIGKWLQPRVFQQCSLFLTMSEGMNEYMKERYPQFSDKFKPLLHGFSIPKETKNTALEPIKKPIKFVYSGTLHPSCFDASKRICEVILENPDYELHIFGGSNRRLFKEHNIVGDKVIFHGFVPEEDFNRKLSEADILLLPHGFQDNSLAPEEFKTIFPTRTIPLLYSGRPILAHSPDDVFFTQFLKQQDCAVVVDTKNKKDIEKAIEMILSNQDRMIEIVDKAFQTAQLYNIDKIVGEVRELI